MRTTVDLPDELMRAAKAKAAEGGESLEDLFARAVAKEIGRRSPSGASKRVTVPMIAAGEEPTVSITGGRIAEVLEAEDAERYGSQ